MRSMKCIAGGVALGTFLVGAAGASTNYVWRDCPGPTHNGDSWATAYTNLHDAINDTETEIWVAEGVYVPHPTDRTAYFQMENGVTWYGGFTTQMQTRAERNWTNHQTILSGEIGDIGADTDNSYTIVAGASGGVIDGFVISNAYANGTPSLPLPYEDRGAGLDGYDQSITVRNCTFIDNAAIYGGGAWLYGGTTVQSCKFIRNKTLSGYGGGCVVQNVGGAVSFTNCLFVGNHGASYGGGIAAWDEVSVSGCTFVSNSTPTISIEGGGAIATKVGDARLRDCLFLNNFSERYGGGVSAYGGDNPTIEDCIFVGNSTGYRGAALQLNDVGTEVVKNCLFVGNHVTDGTVGYGSAIYAYTHTDAQIRNCTFAFNRAAVRGGLMYMGNFSDPTLENCIMWANSAGDGAGDGNHIYMGTANDTLTINYGNGATNANWVDGIGDLAGVSNLDVNPFFAGGSTGAWDVAGVYDDYAGRSTLTDSDANWPANSLVGKYVNPDTNQWLQFYIVGNVSTQMTVWGNASTLGAVDADYRIHDYHLQSTAGRWDPGANAGAGDWVTDGEHSDCIDAGTNYVACVEPAPNGYTINMGAYGNTAEASKSLGPGAVGSVIFIR